MLVSLGSEVDLLLRNGTWVKKMTVLDFVLPLFPTQPTRIVLQAATGPSSQASYDMQQDVAVITRSTLLQI